MSRKNKLLIIFIVILIPLFHEIGHWCGYYIDGIQSNFNYGFIYTTQEIQGFYGILLGPLFNFLLSIIAIIILYINKRHKIFWSIISLSSAVGRLLNCLLILLLSLFNKSIILLNDEGKIASLLHFSPYSIYALSIIVYILILFLIKRHIKNNNLYLNITLRIFIYNILISVVLIILSKYINN